MRQHFSKVAAALALLMATCAEGPIADASARRPERATASSPSRVLDTRVGVGAPAGYNPARRPLRVPVESAVVAGATSAVLNITATEATASGWVKAWPCNEPEPAASSLNFVPDLNSANAAIVLLGRGGVCLTTNTAVHLIVDVTGSMTGTDDLTSIVPNRLLDTRIGGEILAAGQELRLAVVGTAGIGNSARFAALNVTVDRPARAGWVVAYPCGQPTNASTVNFNAGDIVANLTLVALADGAVCMRSLVDTNVVVDSFGWSSGLGDLRVQSPNRLIDTRDPSWSSGPVAHGATLQLNIAGRGGVPSDADAAWLTVTVAEPTGTGFVTMWPCGQAIPTASTINTFPGALRSNLAFVKLAADGTACLTYRASDLSPSHVVVDAVGWATGAAARVTPSGPGQIIPPPSVTTGLPTIPGSNTCVFKTASQPVQVAFCDSFDVATRNSATRSGDLDAKIWGVSRTSTLVNFGQNQLNEWLPATLVGCGATQRVLPPNDIQICNGRLYEAVADGEAEPILAMYPKQPFDIAGRTGTVSFDVSANAKGPHNAWPEFWWTDQPLPAPGAQIPGQEPYARNSLGISIANDNCGANGTGVHQIMITRNYRFSVVATNHVGCVTKGSPTDGLNHFEIRVNEQWVEVWGSDAGTYDMKLVATANVAMPLTRGVIWIEDVHYNGCKDGDNQCDHTFAWDNVGFDGPSLYRDLTFDVQDALAPQGNGRLNLGFGLLNPVPLTAPGVYWEKVPTTVYLGFNFWNDQTGVPTFRINGGPWHAMAWPFAGGSSSWRTIAVPVALSEIRTGANSIEFQAAATAVVSNINIILIDAAPAG
ncbi:MAG: hypothetical protein ABIP03_04205 [Aquihabitans sp.]